MKKRIIFLVLALFVFSLACILVPFLESFFSAIGEPGMVTSRKAWHIAPKGIAVDANDNFYLGVPELIMAFDRQGNFLHSYKVYPRATYYFTVDQADNLVITGTQYVTVYSLAGELLEQRDIRGLSRLSVQKTARAVSGTTYTLTNRMGYTKVVQTVGGTPMLVYRIPLKLYIAKLAIPVAIVLYGTLIAYCTIKLFAPVLFNKDLYPYYLIVRKG